METKKSTVRQSKKVSVFASACEAIQVRLSTLFAIDRSKEIGRLTWIASLRSQRRVAGFTLVELIVVVTILVILGTIAFVSLSGFSGSARDSSRVSDLSLISKSLDLYYAKQGAYPSPASVTTITYSWATVWYQGTVGDSVVLALGWGGSKVSKKPIDPLLSTEYIYSLASELQEYSLAANYEGNSVSLDTDVLWGGVVYAETGNPTLSYIKGNYNGVVMKVSTGSKVNLLAVPSIITASGVTTLIAGSQTGFLVNGQTNSGYLFIPRLVYSSWALPNNDTDRIAFASGVAGAYSGTSLASNGNIAQFISASNNTGALASIGGSFVGTKLGGVAATNVVSSNTHGKQVFSYSGSDQTFIVPASVSSIAVKLWGAGGYGSSAGSAGGYGGGGGFVSGSLSVSPWQLLTIIVGRGGVWDSTIWYGGGGRNGGGGRSAIGSGSSDLVTAGGGGAWGANYAGSPATPYVNGGAGGGSTGWAGSTSFQGANGGWGGTQSAGWSAGAGYFTAPSTIGLQYIGGTGAAQGAGIYAGGGGGYYGGGGGGEWSNPWNMWWGGWGGGSSYTGSLTSAANIQAGANGAAAGTWDIDYLTGIAIGSGNGSNGGNGLVIISW